MGPSGLDGIDGLNGLNCWDVNGNGDQDSSEDINSDGEFTTQDCIASADLSEIMQRLSYLESRLKDSDFDNDGFSPAHGDCDDSIFDVNPNVAEIGGDGIDNNCDGFIDNTQTSPPVDTSGIGLVINEVDYDNAGTDTLEYVEIYNLSAYAIDVTGLKLAFINGTDGSIYRSIDLSGAIDR